MQEQEQKIKARLEKLKRQEAYIRGMLLAEELAEADIEAEKAVRDRFILFSGLDWGNIIKGYKAQKNAIGKRKAKEEMEKRNLFNMP